MIHTALSQFRVCAASIFILAAAFAMPARAQQDTTPPSVSCSVLQSSLWPPNHNLINVGLSVNVTDATDPNPTVQISVFGDEDDQQSTGDGRHSPDARNLGVQTLRLRAERHATANGRVYLILIRATDASGNVGIDCCTVVVPKSQSRANVASVGAQAAAARAFCAANGAAPPGFFVVGDGPTIGPKQ